MDRRRTAPRYGGGFAPCCPGGCTIRQWLGCRDERRERDADLPGRGMNSSIRSVFPVTQECVYLDTAYVSPQPLPVLAAARAFLDRRSLGTAGRVEDWLGLMDEV